MMRLSELAMHQCRECLLIAFAEAARPIDMLASRAVPLRFFPCKAQGNPNAKKMIDLLTAETTRTPRYAGADVLWVSDFRIPQARQPQLAKMERLRDEGTRFYGLQIGIAENFWKKHFDEMIQITK